MFDLSQVPLFALIDRRLGWIDRRQQVLAQNIANADTPGWRAHDLKPFASLLAAPTIALAASEGAQMAGQTAAAAPAEITPRTEIAPDGNSVVLDKELMKVADTDTAHALAVQLTRTYLGMFRTTIGR